MRVTGFSKVELLTNTNRYRLPRTSPSLMAQWRLKSHKDF